MPVVVIHLVAFAILYVVMYRFAVANLENTHKFGASILLDQLELNFRDLMNDHAGPSVRMRLAAQAQAHKLVRLAVFDGEGTPLVSTVTPPSDDEVALARVILSRPQHPTMWLTSDEGGERLFGVRVLKNEETCQVCHGPHLQSLGVIQMGVDLTEPMAAARAGVRKKFALVGMGWLGLFAFMVWIRWLVIGRPLRQIQSTIDGADTGPGRPHDLEALADRLHVTIWQLIETQRQREKDITHNMARAEQLAALGELAAGLTHEIKNPLAGVIAALEILRDERESTETAEVFEEMLSELRRVTATLGSLLRLAKPQPPQRAEIDVSRVVREVVSLFSARLRRQGIDVDLSVSEPVPPLPLDSGMMVQLLVNLLTNSLQATERGGKISVLVAPFPRRDGVVLAISDSGRGIAEADLEKIFDPFFTTKEEGTGLGLAICRQIVEQHGGTIDIESEVGKGTRVVVLLPDDRAKEEERANDGLLAAG